MNCPNCKVPYYFRHDLKNARWVCTKCNYVITDREIYLKKHSYKKYLMEAEKIQYENSMDEYIKLDFVEKKKYNEKFMEG